MMVKSDSGEISSSFYIRENSEGEGIYSLLWNASDDASAIPVSLRTAKPSDSWDIGCKEKQRLSVVMI